MTSRPQCPDTMLLPPQRDGRRLQCELASGHDGHHSAEGDGARRRWPSVSAVAKDPTLRSARASAGANITSLKGRS